LHERRHEGGVKGGGVRSVALLRGVNVGKAKRIAMADLRALVERLGYRDVKTLLNSGNVVFTRPASSKGDPAARLEKAIASELGVSCAVVVLSAEELDEIVRANPLGHRATDPSRFLVAVFRSPEGLSALRELERREHAPDALAFGRRAAYLWCARGLLESPLAVRFLKASKEGATTRNWATITKLHALATGAA
jgi:uncharacterized protein (DUF1697 family)